MRLLRRRWSAFLLASVLPLAACDESEAVDVSVASVRVTVAQPGRDDQVISIGAAGTPSPVVLTVGVTATVSAVWLDGSGGADPVNTNPDYVLNLLLPSPNLPGFAVALVGTDNHALTLTAASATAASQILTVQLFNQRVRTAAYEASLPVRVDAGTPAPL